MNKNKPLITLSLSALFAAVTVICTYIAVPTPMPFTLQTLAIFLACFFLGFKGAFLSTLTYILLGVVGLPVFTGFRGGFSALLEPTGGFIIGFLFIPVAYGILCGILGKKFEAIWLFIGLLFCYLTGSLWYLIYTDENSYPVVLLTTVAPFVLLDIIKLFVAFVLSNTLKKATAKFFCSDDKRISPSVIAGNMKNKAKIFVFSELDSTNSEAVRRLRQGIVTPSLFIAEKQTAGRGRRGRSFFSEGGLYMTLAVDCNMADTVGLTTLAAVVTAEAVEELTGIRVGIKWVNDLYLNDKKVCGILCEKVKDPETDTHIGDIIGIGVNLNVKDFPQELQNIAGSLITENVTHCLLAAKITDKLLNELNTPSDHISRYRERSLVLGKQITFEQNGVVQEGVASDITNDGGLVVQTADGSTEILTSGEITLRVKK